MADPLPDKQSDPALSQGDRQSLKIFFWFAFALICWLIYVAPSVKTVGLLLGLLWLGYPLFAKKDQKRIDSETTSEDPALRNKPNWSTLSWRSCVVIVFCTVATPWAFGLNTLSDPISLFLLGWLGMFLGVTVALTYKLRYERQRNSHEQ